MDHSMGSIILANVDPLNGMGNNYNLSEKLMLCFFSLSHVTSACNLLFLTCQFPSKEREIANLTQIQNFV